MKQLNLVEIQAISGAMGSRGQVAPVDTPCTNAVMGGAMAGAIGGIFGGPLAFVVCAFGGAFGGFISAGRLCRLDSK
ncbi:hypothetical protein [Rugamonas rubra]|uniref:hypothetical protein n=1 Tax=Rugamonas rubra TaxID=758825 RepID=UPI001C2DB6F1|nr:hypothetical protein [Rugamonas rubra]